MKHWPTSRIALLVLVSLLLLSASVLISHAAQTPAREAVTGAWQLADAVGKYEYATTLHQTTTPLPTLVNVGLGSATEAIYLEGETDRAADSLRLKLWSGSGSVLQDTGALEIKIEDGRASGRVNGSAWEPIEDVTTLFAPGRDPLGFLHAAQDIRRLTASESSATDAGVLTPIQGVTKYAFTLDGPTFAAYMRDQLEEELRRRGELPAGLRLDQARLYLDMAGQGEIWLNRDGLPVRMILDVQFPPTDNEQIDVAITTDFYAWDDARVAASTTGPFAPVAAILTPENVHAGAQALAWTMLVVAVSLLFWKHMGSRKLYTGLAVAIIVSMLITPMLQSMQVQAFYEAYGTQADTKANAAAAPAVSAPQYNTLASPPLVPSLQSSTEDDTLPYIDDGTDADEDGLTDVQEEIIGTDPDDADSDGDGLSDGIEVNELGTSPLQADSDGDGISDDLEVRGYTGPDAAKWYLDPFSADTNQDGLQDGVECTVEGGALVCPDADGDNVPDAFDDDNDGDGVPDNVDLSPDSLVGDPTTGLEDQTFRFEVDDLTAGAPVFLDFQLRPTNPDHLWYAMSVLDWPTRDTKGQIQRVHNSTFGDTGVAANGDLRLTPVLEIEIPFENGHYGNLPTIDDPPPITAGTPITAWLDTAETELYGISVRKKDDSGALLAYVPLALSRAEAGDSPTAFSGRMLYWPLDAGWGPTQEARLLWLLEAITDSCTPMPDDYVPPVNEDDDEDNDLGEEEYGNYWCEVDADGDGVPDNWVENDPSIVHGYYDDFYLTGLSVQENHGLQTAVVYQDPTTAPADLHEDNLFALAQGLDHSFISGRDEGTGTRTLTVDEVQSRFDKTQNGGVGDDERWDIPAGAFFVERNDFTHGGYLGVLASTNIPDILENTYTPQVDTGIDDPTLLILREERMRTFTLDRDSLVTPLSGGNNGVSLTADADEVPALTIASMNWVPYRYRGDMWEPYPLDEYWNNKESSYSAALAGGWADPEDLQAATIFARAYYFSLVNGSSRVVEVDGVPADLPVSMTDADITSTVDLAAGKAVKSQVSNFLNLLTKLFGKEILIGGLGGPLVSKFTLLHSTFINYYSNNYNNGAERLKIWGLDNVDDDPLTPKEVLRSFDLLGEQLKNDPSLKTLRRIVSASDALGLAGTLLAAATITANIVVTSLQLAGVIAMDSQAVKIAFAAANLVATSVSFASVSLALGAYTLSKGLTTAAKLIKDVAGKAFKIGKASAVFFAITAAITVGFFIYQVVAEGITAFSLSFNQLLAGLIADLVVGVIMLVIAAIPVIGALIAVLIALIDGLIALICSIAVDPDDPDQEVVNDYVCGGITGLLKKLIQFMIYDQTPLVDLENEGRLNLTNFDVTLADPDLGFIVGNSVDVAIDVDTALYKPTLDSLFALAYAWQHSDENIKESTFVYELRPDQGRIDESLELGAMSSSWQAPASGGWAENAAFVSREAVADTVLLRRSGVNRPLQNLYLAEGYVINAQECWGTPMTPVCYLREQRDTLHMNIGQALVFDVFPTTLSEFLALAPQPNGGYALAWDDAFPTLQDADADGLRSAVFGGNDPDDGTPDTDNDGLSDYFEIQNGFDPEQADADGDGLTDDLEYRYGTNPFRADSDNDGLTDKEELDGWIFVYAFDGATPVETLVRSDPLDPNFDGDDYLDSVERAYGFNPWVPSSGGVLEIESDVAPEHRIVMPGETIPYTVTLRNALRSNFALGLLDVDFPAAVSNETLLPQPFNLTPQESVTTQGQVTVNPVAASQTISLTNIAGAAIVDPRTAVGGRSLWLRLDEAAGGSSYADASLNAFAVSCIGADCPTNGVPGYRNTAANFDNDRLNVAATAPELGLVRQSFTVMAWIKMDAKGTSTVLGTGGSSSSYMRLGLDYDLPYFQLGGAAVQGSDEHSMDTDRWYHLVGRYQYDRAAGHGTLSVFLDGVLVDSQPGVAPLLGSAGFLIGTDNMWAFDGSIDEVEVFPFALSDGEIAAVTTDRVFYLKAEQPIAMSDTLSDNSAYGNPITCAPNPDNLNESTCPFHSASNGYVDSGYRFNNEHPNERLHVGPNPNLDLSRNGGAFSIAAWVNPAGPSLNHEGHMMGKGRAANGDYEYPSLRLFKEEFLEVSVALMDENGDNCVFDADMVTPSSNQWDHVVATFDGNQFRVYVNAEEVDGDHHFGGNSTVQPDCQGRTPRSEDEFFIGGFMANDDGFAGAVDELQIFNYTLQPKDVANIFWDSQPVLDMRFDEPPARTIFADRSFGAFEGSCAGDACPLSGIQGREMQAVHFDGVDDVIALTANAQDLELSQSSFTLATWAYLDGAGRHTAFGSNGFGSEYLSLGVDNGVYKVNLGAETLSAPSPLQTGRWYHLAARYAYDDNLGDGDLTLFINGSEVETMTDVAPLSGAPQLFIGRDITNHFAGMIDRLQVFRTALTDAQISNLTGQVPMLNLHLDEAQGATTFASAAGSQNATCSGAGCPNAGVKGKVYQGLAFDGQDDTVSLNNIDLQSFSIGMWVKPTQRKPAPQPLFDKTGLDLTGNPHPILTLAIAPNSMQLQTEIAGDPICGFESFYSDATLLQNLWNHVMLTYEDNTVTFFINGSEAGSYYFFAPFGICNQTRDIHLGTSEQPDLLPFTGEMDEVVVYPVALSARDVGEMVNFQSSWFDTSFGHTVVVDADDPQVSLQVSAPHLPGTDKVLAIQAGDITSGVALVEYNINGAGWQPASRDGDIWLFTFQPSGDGAYTIDVRATDHAGNVGVNAHTVNVDATPPTVVSTNADGGAILAASRNGPNDVWDVHFEGTISAGAGVLASPLESVHVQAFTPSDALTGRLQVTQLTDLGSGNTAFEIDYPYDVRPNGVYTFTVEAVDAVGNLGRYTVPAHIDGTPPRAQVTTPVSNTVFVDDAGLVFGSAAETGLVQSDVDRVEIAFQPADLNEASGVPHLPADLLLYLPLNENVEDENGQPTDLFADASGNGHDATCSGACPTAGERGYYGNAPRFDGAAQALTVDNIGAALTAGELTFGGWALPQDGASGVDVLFAFKEDGEAPTQMVAYDHDQQQFFYADAQTGDVYSANTFAPDAWHQVVVTVDGAGDGVLYVDGVQEATFTTDTRPTASDGFKLGRAWNGADNRHFAGQLDDVFVYNRALAFEDLRRLYRGYAPVLRLPLDDDKLLHGDTVEETSRYGNATQFVKLTLTDTVSYPLSGIVGPGAYDFAANAYVAVDPQPHFDLSDGQYTQALWVRPHGTGGGPLIAPDDFSIAAQAGAYPSLFVDNVTGRLHVGFGDGSLFHAYESAWTVPRDAWTFVAVTFDGATMNIYANGQLVDTTDAFAGFVPAPATDFNVGQYNTGGNDIVFNGLLDEVTIYRQALSARQIEGLYHQGWHTTALAEPGLPSTTWDYTIPYNLDGAYQIQLRTTDGQGNISHGNQGMLDWEGYITTLAGSITVVKDAEPAVGTNFAFSTDALAPGEFVAAWGSNGNGDGEFAQATDVAVDPDGNVYVVDRANHRVQKFDETGAFLTAWGSQGNGAGEFESPAAIAIGPGGRLYVTDVGNRRVQVFDAAGTPLGQWGSSGDAEGQFLQPTGIAVDAAGNVYVADGALSRVQKFDGDGAFLLMWGWGVDSGANALETCIADCRAGITGAGQGQFDQPWGIAAGLHGFVYVVDNDNHNVQKFDGAGNFILSWGGSGIAPGQFASPYGAALDPAGNVYVADNDNERVQMFDADGAFLAQWGDFGSDDGQFMEPRGVAVDPTGFAYVSDWNLGRIQKFGLNVFVLDDAIPDDGDRFSDTRTLTNLLTGAYTVSEIAGPGWETTSVTCDAGDWSAGSRNQSATVALVPGEDVTCTFSNEPNTPPTLSNLSITASLDENELATLTGNMHDPDIDDALTLTAHWGDGAVTTYTYAAGTTVFTETHRYLDDDPSGTPFDDYTVTVTLTDGGADDEGTATTTVHNLPPAVNAGSDLQTGDTFPVSFSGVFTDPGSLDTHTMLWEFGDGMTASGVLTPTHTYPGPGVYTATLTVSDDDGGVGSDSLRVTVNELTDLSLTKEARADSALAGATLGYTLVATNEGPSTATGVTITDTLPSGVTFRAAGAGCVEASGVVVCDVGDLSSGASASTPITVSVDVTTFGRLTNTAVVGSNETDPNPDNNHDTAVVDVPTNEVVYHEDFEDGAGDEWECSSPVTATTPVGKRTFLGQFGPQKVCLTLDNLPEHNNVTLGFDLYIINSWDGNQTTAPQAFFAGVLDDLVGPDRWQLEADNIRRLDTTFSNWPDFRQAYPGDYPNGDFPAWSGAVEVNTLGYEYGGLQQDAVYRIILTFPHSDESLTLEFISAQMQAVGDESWGLDNVVVTVDAGAASAYETYFPVFRR